MDIKKGFINSTFKADGALRAQVQIDQADPIEDVLLVFPYGYASNPPAAIDGAMVLLFMNRALNFAIPFNPLLEPLLESGGVSVGNFNVGNKITFKANGDIEMESEGAMTLSASTVNIGDAVDLVLNNSASMTVTIPSGSSAGTYPVTIVSPGQTKVSA